MVLTRTPDESGWYWAKASSVDWLMAFVDTRDDEVLFWEGDGPTLTPDRHAIDSAVVDSIRAWYGPFGCPGGDFGETTIVISEEYHQRAKELRKAIVIEHQCFQHCDDDKSGGSVTMFSWRTREESLEHQAIESRYRELQRENERIRDERNDFGAYAYAADEWLAGRITTEQMRETFKGLQKPGG